MKKIKSECNIKLSTLFFFTLLLNSSFAEAQNSSQKTSSPPLRNRH